ncbi:hypothetical protein FRC11_009974 [Ceratobasidium sp. 423]|nr:hypothetical protein FRC11_009974 [Ceratobasidium sp. 423]
MSSSSTSSSTSSSGSSTRVATVNEALTALHQAKGKLKAVSNTQGSQPPNQEENDAAKELNTEMSLVRSAISETKKSAQGWKGPPKRKPSKAATKPNKPPKVAKKVRGSLPVESGIKPEFLQDKEEESNDGTLVGSECFRKEMQDMMNSGEYTIDEWYKAITAGDPGTIFDLASYGLYVVATGIANVVPKEMTWALAMVLAPHALKLEVLGSVESARIVDIHTDELFNDPHHALNKRPQIELLQHMVLGVQAAQSSITWSRIEKGSKNKEGRGAVVQRWYREKCEAKGEDADFGSSEFGKFASGVKDYNSGANRFLEAYKQLGSILLLCPLFNIYRFLNSDLGPKLKKAIGEMAKDDREGKLKGREPMHRRILFKIICILDDDEDPMLIAA